MYISNFFDHACHDIFTHSFDHDYDSLNVDVSKHVVFDDLLADEVETPQVVEELQPELMVISGSCSLQVSSTSDHRTIQFS